jgi:hypothetical protein
MKPRTFLGALLVVGACVATAGAEERQMSDLAVRCLKMRDMQTEVCNGTKRLAGIIASLPDKQPRPEDRQEALRLAGKTRAIVEEATRIIHLMEKDDMTAVAFPEAFRQVRDDMINVQRRLERCDVGRVTQDIEQDIIDSLNEMTRATGPG